MRFSIRHTTRYEYSRPVFLEPHRMLLRPRCDAWQALESFEMRFETQPAGCSKGLDAEGNSFTQCWFDGLASSLEIETSSIVHTMLENPYDFLLETGAQHLPPELPTDLQTVLAPALRRSAPGGHDPVRDFAAAVQAEADNESIRFCTLLVERLHSDFEKLLRFEPGIMRPELVLEKKAGACRDLSLLFMDACRTVGLPARFVSGYQDPQLPKEDAQKDAHDLHAWAEVFIPGGGWRGFDPTHGLATAGRHVALAASTQPELAMPVQGSFRGTGAVSTLSHSVSLTPLDRETT